MEFTEVQRKIIDCILQGKNSWSALCATIDTYPAVITLACIKLEQDLVIKNHHCNYSLFLYSSEMI